MIGVIDSRKRWHFPTDRELMLRAKLNSGWSVHTRDVFRKMEYLSKSQLEWIEDVLLRSQKIEQFEQERIGGMVERLKNLQSNALGDGTSTCAMCARPFGIFRKSAVICYDCSMTVCDKCRVDTFIELHAHGILCKICVENREFWKKSGGWFYRKIPAHILPHEADNQDKPLPKISMSYGTWEHRTPEIVRFQSFEPPETDIENSLYNTNWATNSKSDSSSDKLESTDSEECDSNESFDLNIKELRSSAHNLAISNPNQRNTLLVATQPLSVSCPSLNQCETEPTEKHPGHEKLRKWHPSNIKSRSIMKVKGFVKRKVKREKKIVT